MTNYRKHFLVLLLLWVGVALNAAPLTREQARLRAVEFLKNARGSRQLAPVQNLNKLAPRRAKAADSQLELYYVFNRGESEGYVIASGDDRTLPILGYTDNGEFDYNTLPDNMRSWLDSREQELLELSMSPASGEPHRLPIHNRIDAMVTTKWNQGAPFNQECPMYFTLGRSVTGCVATAMAQILYYQRAKSVTETQAEIPGYTCSTNHPTYGKLTVEGIPAGSPIDWDNMVDTYGSSATEAQKRAVAQLMHYCGVAVYMNYTNSASSAYNYYITSALQKYFGYGSNTRLVYKASYSDEAWDNLIYKEIEAGRPVYLSGSNDGGGHAFVCDGYDGNYCYHINWGWGGTSDGFFLLSKLNPSSQGIGGSSGGYNNSNEAIIGWEPAEYGDKAMSFANATVKALCTKAFDRNGDGVFSYEEAATVTDLGTVFKDQTGITTFDELRYFTSLTTIPDSAFAGCTKLTMIKLPNSIKHIGANAFYDCRVLKNFFIPAGVKSMGKEAFFNCRVLPNQQIPIGVSRIESRTFGNCLAFTDMELHSGISYIGDQAFSGSTKLTNVTLKTFFPQYIELGSDVFSGINLSAATLNCMESTRQYFATTDQWKEFGTINEKDHLSRGKFASLEANKKFYIYNVGMGGFLTKGEAYGTQAVVADIDAPMTFEFRQAEDMPDGVYYLYSNDTGKSNHILFRSNTDNMVGNGVNACFVDGKLSENAYWKVALVEGKDNIYTLQIPDNFTDYKPGQFLGIQPSHASNAATPTYGAYSDVEYSDYGLSCQWMLVAYDETGTETYQRMMELKNLLDIATSKRIDAEDEWAVYSNHDSDIDTIDKACRNLRRQLGFINFTDRYARSIFMTFCDADQNGEISYAEAANIQAKDLSMNFYNQPKITDLTELKYFTGLTYLFESCFHGCSSLRNIVIPESVVELKRLALGTCSSLTSIEIPKNVTIIGDRTFYSCKGLKEVRLAVNDPNKITLGSEIFTNLDLSTMVLYVPQGSKELYAQANVWKDFGEIREMRGPQTPDFTKPEANTDYYIYNMGMKGYIGKGEAWGTQATIDTDGLVYQLRRTASMPDGVYYLYSDGTGSNNHAMFRTSTDDKVGQGVKTCFVDGAVTNKTYWKIQEVEGLENVYTLSVPETEADYVAGEYLGTDKNHTSNFAKGTHGLYWDINYENNPLNCQWGFISVKEVEAAKALFALTETLKELLVAADAREVEATAEHAVYDNFESTEEEVSNAINSLRRKLGYIDFADSRAKTLCVNKWDTNEDGELDMTEAAAVTNISTVFRSATSMKNFEELRYFTSLTKIPDEAFRGCTTLTSIYLPAGVTSIGSNAFASCSALKYMAVLNEKGTIEATDANLPAKLTAFVSQNLLDIYSENSAWSKATIREFTGVPTITATDASRQYGRSNPGFSYEVTGAPVNGEPTLTCEAVAKSPVGEYAITVKAGTITSANLATVDGTLTIERAPLTLTARSFTRNKGEENPEFTFINSTLRNSEKIDDILLVRPTLTCEATADSPAGVYEICIFGAETENYEITYVNGKLTVEDTDAIQGIEADGKEGTAYDLSGRPTKATRRGVYIVNGKKVVK